MWPWRRSPSPDAAPRPARVPAADGPAPFTRAPEPRGDWQLLAPIQRVTTEPELINPVSRFQGSLAAWQNPSFTGPLGHRLGAGEPSGVITDITTARPDAGPVHVEAGAPMPLAVAPPPPRPAVQRLASFAGPAPAAPSAGHPVAATPLPAAPAAGPGLPVLTLPTVGVVGDLPATSAGASAPEAAPDTAPTLGDRGEPLPTPPSGYDDAGTAPGTVAGSGLAMPVVPPPTGASTPTVARVTDASGTAGSSAAPPATPTPRRIGLGEPIVGPRPVEPAVQRLPLATPPSAGSPAGGGTADAPLLGARSTLDAAVTAGGAETATAATPGAAFMPVSVPVLAPATVASYPTLAPPASTPSSASARPLVARLVGDAPPLIAPPSEPGGGPVDAGGAYPGAPGPASAATGGGGGLPAVPVQRIADPAVAPPRPAPMAPMVYASGASAPAPVAQRSPGAAAGIPIAALPLATASWVHPAVVQRIETVREVPVPQVVTVQREESGDGGAATSPAETTPAAAAPAAAGGNDADSMLAKLFDPLLAKIKTELRLDRERRGALTDLWH